MKYWERILKIGVLPATIQGNTGKGTWIVGVFPAAVQGSTRKGTWIVRIFPVAI